MGIEGALIMSALLLGLIFLVLLVVAVLMPGERREPERKNGDIEKIKSQINGEDEW